MVQDTLDLIEERLTELVGEQVAELTYDPETIKAIAFGIVRGLADNIGNSNTFRAIGLMVGMLAEHRDAMEK